MVEYVLYEAVVYIFPQYISTIYSTTQLHERAKPQHPLL